MSVNQTINQSINTIIESFVEAVSSKYDIDRQELFTLLEFTPSSMEKPTQKKILTKTVASSDASPDLQKCTVSDLKAMLKLKGLKMTGTKDQLIARYLDGKNETMSAGKPSVQSVMKTKVSEQVKVPVLQIRKNQYGFFEHMESGLVFNTDKKVVGKMKEDGTVSELDEEIVDLCNKYKFEYEIPESFENEVEEEVKEMEEEDELEEEELVDEEEEELVDEDEE
jgi:hypothetical protein